jgi:putative phosphoribosyl transferase
VFFRDRRDAGRRLAARLEQFEDAHVVVLGLPRGGVPVAAEVAAALDATLDVCLVRKLGAPSQPELAMGAIGEGGVRVVNDDVVTSVGATEADVARVERREREVLTDRARRYRRGRQPVPLAGRTVLIVDDGIATGSTVRVACRIARARGAARIVLCVPVGPGDVEERLHGEADDIMCLLTPRDFFAVGQYYTDFAQIGDDEVIACLDRAARLREEPPIRALTADRPVGIAVGGGVVLRGVLSVPEDTAGMVVFAHGSGSSRRSPRNRAVAAGMEAAGLGTLLFDLLTEQEERDRANVFDTGLLADRLAAVTGWLEAQPEAVGLPVGYFGASTGAAAALWAAAEPGSRIAAVVSRGGRPDLADARLPAVTSPTLLVVGGSDPVVLDLNRSALARLRCESRLAVVPGATHLFEEPGTLQQVTELSRDWFTAHMSPAPAPAP